MREKYKVNQGLHKDESWTDIPPDELRRTLFKEQTAIGQAKSEADRYALVTTLLEQRDIKRLALIDAVNSGLAVNHKKDQILRLGVWESFQRKIDFKSFKADPVYHFKLHSAIKGKERDIVVPSIKNQIIENLACYTLKPIFEINADESSYAYREDRNIFDFHDDLLTLLKKFHYSKYVLVLSVRIGNTIAFKNWIISKTPYDTSFLKRLFESGQVVDSELFPRDFYTIRGSNSLNHYLGNHILDGLDGFLGRSQGDILRYAKYIVVVAETAEICQRHLERISSFLYERGLDIEESHISSSDEGFTVLSRTYIGVGEAAQSHPSKDSIKNFIKHVKTILDLAGFEDEKTLGYVNYLIKIWSLYHRTEDDYDYVIEFNCGVRDAFIVSHHEQTGSTYKSIYRRYWRGDESGKFRYIDETSGIKLMDPFEIEPFDNEKIKFALGDAKGGRCFLCGRVIYPDQQHCELDLGGAPELIHRFCLDNIYEKVELIEEADILNDYDPEETSVMVRIHYTGNVEEKEDLGVGRNYVKLKEFFRYSNRSTLVLSFDQINDLTGGHLSKYAAAESDHGYWDKRKGVRNIRDAYESEGYVGRVNKKNQTVTFTRKIKVPAEIKGTLPPEAKYRLDKFMEFLRDKYDV